MFRVHDLQALVVLAPEGHGRELVVERARRAGAVRRVRGGGEGAHGRRRGHAGVERGDAAELPVRPAAGEAADRREEPRGRPAPRGRGFRLVHEVRRLAPLLRRGLRSDDDLVAVAGLARRPVLEQVERGAAERAAGDGEARLRRVAAVARPPHRRVEVVVVALERRLGLADVRAEGAVDGVDDAEQARQGLGLVAPVRRRPPDDLEQLVEEPRGGAGRLEGAEQRRERRLRVDGRAARVRGVPRRVVDVVVVVVEDVAAPREARDLGARVLAPARRGELARQVAAQAVEAVRGLVEHAEEAPGVLGRQEAPVEAPGAQRRGAFPAAPQLVPQPPERHGSHGVGLARRRGLAVLDQPPLRVAQAARARRAPLRRLGLADVDGHGRRRARAGARERVVVVLVVVERPAGRRRAQEHDEPALRVLARERRRGALRADHEHGGLGAGAVARDGAVDRRAVGR